MCRVFSRYFACRFRWKNYPVFLFPVPEKDIRPESRPSDSDEQLSDLLACFSTGGLRSTARLVYTAPLRSVLRYPSDE